MRLRVGNTVCEVPDDQRPVYAQAGGQYRAFWSTAFELLGGGSAGGGKSWYLVQDALGWQFMYTQLGKPAFMVPGYRAVLFRRESTQLDKLISEAKVYYPQYGGVYVGGRQGEPGPCFEFPKYGSKIFFCHMQHEDDKENHQGQEYQYVGFDELTHFTITQYLYLFSRLRSTIPYLTCRVRSTTNPTGPGLWWVRKRFIDKWEPGTTRFFLPPEDPREDPRGRWVKQGTEHASSRVFIPFWLTENKALMDTDPLYATRIMAMGKQMERALLGGDWYAFGGDFWYGFDRHKEIVKPFFIPKAWRLVGSIDPGFSSPCSFGLHARDFKGNLYRISTYYESRRTPDQHAKAIKQFIAECKQTEGRSPDYIVSGHDAFHHSDRYSVVGTEQTFADVFQANGLLLQKASIDRINGWWNWKNLMPDRWFIFEGQNEALLQEMSATESDEKNAEDIKGRGNDPNVVDHALDECRYGLMAIHQKQEPRGKTSSWEDQYIRNATRDSGGKEWKPGRG